MALTDDDIVRIMTSIPEPASDSDNDVAVWVTNLCIVIEAEVQKQDEALIWLMLAALQYHTEQTRPIARTDDAITAALLRLNGKP